MGFLEVLNKHAYKINMNQCSSYKMIIQEKALFDRYRVNVKIKNEFDLVRYEILYRGLFNMKQIEDAYDKFVFDNYDILSYLNYDEKVRMFNADLKDVLSSMPMFYDEANDINIYMPIYDSSLNHKIVNNYELLQLKHHKEYINSLKIDVNTPIELYGEKLYLTDFSPLKNVYEDERHICIYFDTFKKMYIIKKDTKTILNEIVFVDHYIDYSDS